MHDGRQFKAIRILNVIGYQVVARLIQIDENARRWNVGRRRDRWNSGRGSSTWIRSRFGLRVNGCVGHGLESFRGLESRILGSVLELLW